MEHVNDFSDGRNRLMCTYCGGPFGTRDHVPSKFFLDLPYPNNLAVVPCCHECNHVFANDEEYTVAFIDVALIGSIDDEECLRPKVAASLMAHPALAKKIEAGRRDTGSGLAWQPETARIERVVIKLAKGHAACDLALPLLDDPTYVAITPLSFLTERERIEFEEGFSDSLWPEVGSREMQSAALSHPRSASRWHDIQPSRYRYMVSPAGPRVRIVLSEYLACDVIWSDSP